MPSEFEDAYEDKERIRGALFTTAIGKLTMRMPVLIDSGATVADAVTAMNGQHIGCVLVQTGGKLVGIFTERDVLKRVALHEGSRAQKVEAVMTRNPATLEANQSLAFALNKMSVGGYRHIPIVDDGGRPVSVLSIRDIVDFIVELFPEDLVNLPPDSKLAIPKTMDGG